MTITANALSFAALLLFLPPALAADLPSVGLSLIYSTNEAVCNAATETLRHDRNCRDSDAINCPDSEATPVRAGAAMFNVIQEIAVNEYGYTRVARALGGTPTSTAIIYIDRFQGYRMPPLLETWKVDEATLTKVLALPPGPLLSTSSIPFASRPEQSIHADAFAALLANGEKIADEWSPVLPLGDELYAVKRECSGLWLVGGYYACNRVNKLTVIRLNGKAKARPVCQFARRNQALR
ncbi:hypothetical protein [Massilia sp. S19_KUP03_FR1]|uniref:hypothetical protein n=1 Tax=Massilia sp. S19_KUP03_FR1 TaxID=3025503 RepID=UPI002FCDD555